MSWMLEREREREGDRGSAREGEGEDTIVVDDSRSQGRVDRHIAIG